MNIKNLRYSELGIGCQHPSKVYNRYTSEWLYVSCGHCKSCLQSKASSYVTQLTELQKNSKTVIFFTLTYNDEHLPLIDFSTYSSSHVYSIVNCVASEYTLADVYNYTETDIQMLSAGSQTITGSSYGPYRIAVLQKKHAQLFLKKFRHYVERKTDYTSRYGSLSDTFKYYLIGEYGSATRRPHYHGIFYFANDVPLELVQDAIGQAWRKGRYDVQVVETSAASYCASYLNTVGANPAYLEDKNFRQFQIHSKARKGVPFTMFKSQASDFLRSSLEEVAIPLVSIRQQQGDLVVTPIPRASRIHFFPRLRRASTSSFSQMVSIYQRYFEGYVQFQQNPWFDGEKLTTEPRFCFRNYRTYFYGVDGAPYEVEFNNEPLWLTLSEALRYNLKNLHTGKTKFQCPWDSTCEMNYLLDSTEVYNLYISKKVYSNYKLYVQNVKSDISCSFADYCAYIVAYNYGTNYDELVNRVHAPIYQSIARKRTCYFDGSCDNSSYPLYLLRTFFSTLERVIERPEELHYYYDKFIHEVYSDIWMDYNYIDIFESEDDDLRATARAIALKASEVPVTIKHKERNSYLHLQQKNAVL